MIFNPAPLAGAFTIELEQRRDDRGFFARLFCTKEFSGHGLEPDFVQINNSLTRMKGTLRGMHYQLPPAAEVKLVRCVRGAVFDVIVDLRPDSPTFRRSFGAELNSENRTMMYVPRGFAHGFLTLEPDSEVFYLVSTEYSPQAERGLRWNDPVLSIDWPMPVTEISEKDRSWPDISDEYHGMARFAAQ